MALHFRVGFNQIQEILLFKEKTEGIIQGFNIEICRGILNNGKGSKMFPLAPEILQSDIFQAIQTVSPDTTLLDHIKVCNVTLTLPENKGPFWKKINGGFLNKLHQFTLIQFAERKFVAEEFQNNCMGNSICVHEPAQTEKLRINAG